MCKDLDADKAGIKRCDIKITVKSARAPKQLQASLGLDRFRTARVASGIIRHADKIIARGVAPRRKNSNRNRLMAVIQNKSSSGARRGSPPRNVFLEVFARAEAFESFEEVGGTRFAGKIFL